MGGRFGTDRIWAEALRRVATNRSVVLGYHGVNDTRRSEDVFRLLVSPAQFARHVELLAGAGFRFVTVTELAERIDGDGPPRGLAAISFDDGLRDNYTTAAPILRRWGIPATVYVIAGLIGGHSPWIRSGAPGEMLREDEIRSLAAEGWEIGAHTMTHPDLSLLGYAACREEIERSRAALQSLTNGEISSFSYPFGRYGPAAAAAVRDLGFTAAVTTGSGSWSHHELTRAMVSAGDPLPILMLKLTDRYEPALQNPMLRTARTASKQLRAFARGRLNDQSPAGPPAY